MLAASCASVPGWGFCGSGNGSEGKGNLGWISI
jgi:hypothetical protein